MIDKREIMLVDDNEVANYYNQDIVDETMLFDHVLVFSNPVKALDLLLERIASKAPLPGFILLDVQMPLLTGFEFLQKLEPALEDVSIKPNVFILTTSSHRKDHEQFQSSQLAKDYLNKPLTVEMLLEKLYKEIDK